MISQLRTYTVNRGMMDQWVKLFAETLVPMQEKHGIRIDGIWTNEDQNQFVWIRSFNDAEDLAAKEKAFYGSDEWKGIVDHARSHLARVVVQQMEPASGGEASINQGGNQVSQLRIYTVNRGMMDAWSKLFTESLVSIQENQGIKVDGMWVNDDKTQFIWIRSFADADDVKAKGSGLQRVSGVEGDS